MPQDPELVRVTDLFYLALTLWREARGEPEYVKRGVAFVVLYRAQHPGWWGSDIATVVTKKWQFSSLTDPKDKQLTLWPTFQDSSWLTCLKVARDVYGGATPNPAPDADSYYDISIPAPKWATPATFVCQLGRIRFHRAREVG